MLATQNDDGTPHLAPVMFLFDGERIIIETGAVTRKARRTPSSASRSKICGSFRGTSPPGYVL